MPKFLKFAAAILLALALALGIAVLLLPDHYEVRREVTIEADPATIHPHVEQLARWPEWCAWNVENFPTLQNTFSGPERGVDCTWTWTMDEGPGSLRVTASDVDRGVWFDLTFGEPGREMHCKGVIQYELIAGDEQAGSRTLVSWTNQGQLSGIAKLMGPLLDSKMGADFEAGLAELKRQVEAAGA